MNLVVRRRLAAGALLSSSALVAGLLLAPDSSAASGGLQVIPSSVVNTDSAVAMSYKSSNVDFTIGSTETFSRIGGGQPFTATTGRQNPATDDNHVGTGTKDFTDVDGSPSTGGGVGIDGPADAGVYNVSVTAQSDPTGQIVTGGSDSCGSCFTVLSPGAVSVTGATPTSYRPAATGNITIAGKNFERGSHIDFLFADGNVDPLITAATNPKDYSKTGNPDIIDKISTRTSLMRTAHVDSNDAPGARGIRVTNLDGNTSSCTACFFVAGPALSSISPTGGVNDPGTAPVTVTFSGSNVTANGTPRLEFTGNPGGSTRDALSLDPISSTPSNGSSLTGSFDLSNAAPGTYQGVVRDKSTGITNACEQPSCSLFTVVQQSNRKPPTVTGLDSGTAGSSHAQQAGTTQVFNVNGTNFSKGVAISVLNAGATTAATGVTVTAVEFVSPTQVKATIAADKTATSGDYDVTATLTDGTASAACSKCYTVTAAQSTASPSPGSASPSSSPCPTLSTTPAASSSPSSSASSSATASPTASRTPTASGTASPTASSSPSSGGGLPSPPIAAPLASPSATATASISPSASGSPTASGCSTNRRAATLTADSTTIYAGQKAFLHGTGTPGQGYSLQCYTRPSVNYAEARSGTFDTAGSAPTFELNLGRNTRCYLRYTTNPTADQSPSLVVNVRTVLSLSTVRKGVRQYEFRGRNLPRVAGQLITLYRVDSAGREIRTSNLKTDNTGIYKVTRTFSGTGTFRFKVRTSHTNDNAPGVSNTITVTVQ